MVRKLILLLLIVAAFSSCVDTSKIEYTYKNQVVSAKDKGFDGGLTTYTIAFTDGSSKRVDFGMYSYYAVGDTTFWRVSNSQFPAWTPIIKNK